MQILLISDHLNVARIKHEHGHEKQYVMNIKCDKDSL